MSEKKNQEILKRLEAAHQIVSDLCYKRRGDMSAD